MSWWMPHKFNEKMPYLKARTQIIRALRTWFMDNNFDEVQTPILQKTPVMDAHIHGFKTESLKPDLSHDQDLYLQTSPEFSMKKLLVAGLPNIYQIAHVFRNAENSPRHKAEFTMLEWYRANTDYYAMMEDCISILRTIAQKLNITHYSHKDMQCDPYINWEKLSVAGAFRKYTDINLDDCLDNVELFKSAVEKQGVRTTSTDNWDDIFFAIMDTHIEPHLGINQPTILYDYPASMASLSRKKTNNPKYAERFELYICGIELANAFSELTDAKEQLARFCAEMALKKQLYGYQYPIDDDFICALEYGLPPSSGIALGLDRLVMLASGADHINQVIWAET